MKERKMNCKHLILSIAIAGTGGLTGVQAQEAVLTTGGDASGSGGSSSYSVGQVVYTTNTAGTGESSAQGVQQPYEISVVTALEENQEIQLEFLVYPNPTADFLQLNTKDYNLENVSYQLYDLNGKLLENQKLTENNQQIKMEGLVPATYFLKVIEDQEIIKTFRIIKN